MAQTLADCLLRRTMLGLNGDLAMGDDKIAANIGRKFLGWSKERVENELRLFQSAVNRLRIDG